jgi:RNA helicase HrpA
MRWQELPIYREEKRIVETVKENRVAVVVSPTGSGKTTQIPKMLLKAGLSPFGMIGVTQPRRIAAISVASRIAEEMETTLGREVGYEIRFRNLSCRDTKLKIMTDGILLMETRKEPCLSAYDIIMVDEAHERTLNIDFTLGLLKEILHKRADLKVLISSATINPHIFSEYFDNAPIISVHADMYPVNVIYTELQDHSREKGKFRNRKKTSDRGNSRYSEIISECVSIIRGVESRGEQGDFLIFLSGEAPIIQCAEAIEQEFGDSGRIVTLPLFARMSKEEQDRVFLKFEGRRKIVIATNIAETSITIDGIRYVIDTGIAKINDFDTRTGISILTEKPISRASAEQRKGRAGRTAEGVCYRLYSERDFFQREEYTKEEIFRTDLSEVVLRMIDLGIRKVERFDFIASPDRNNIRAALSVLKRLGAIDNFRNLTETGRTMLDFPMEPRFSRMLVEAMKHYEDCLDYVIMAVAFISARTPITYVEEDRELAEKAFQKFVDPMGDLITYIHIFSEFRREHFSEDFSKSNFFDHRTMLEIANIYEQIKDIIEKKGMEVKTGGKMQDVIKACAAGLSDFIMWHAWGKFYQNRFIRNVIIHPSSVLFDSKPDMIVAGEIMKTTQTFARSVSVINRKWVKDLT